MSAHDDYSSPGTAKPAKIRKAACGIRFDDDELQEGIDFSRATDLKPGGPEQEQEKTSGANKQRQSDSHS